MVTPKVTPKPKKVSNATTQTPSGEQSNKSSENSTAADDDESINLVTSPRKKQSKRDPEPPQEPPDKPPAEKPPGDSPSSRSSSPTSEQKVSKYSYEVCFSHDTKCCSLLIAELWLLYRLS